MSHPSLLAKLVFGGYATALTLARPLVRSLLRKRLKKGREHPLRQDERWGRADHPRPAGKLIWVHGASVGEMLSCLPLITALQTRDPELRFLVTTGTLTSAELAGKRLPESAIHQFIPVDVPSAVQNFYDHWRPDLGLILESELWPNLLRMARKRDIPLVLVNARISPRSFKRWKQMKPLAQDLLSCFKLILAQSDVDRSYLQALGMEAAMPGNIKCASPPLPVVPTLLERLGPRLAQRKIWLAASSHPGEETLVVETHKKLRAQHPDLLTLLAPRHPERGAEIRIDLMNLGMKVAQRSADEVPEAETDIFLLDTLGEMGNWYNLAPVVLICGTLVPHGGHNPLEVARFNCAILLGPHMENFVTMTDALERVEAVERCTPETLTDRLDELLNHPDRQKLLAERAQIHAEQEAQVLDRIIDALEGVLP